MEQNQVNNAPITVGGWFGIMLLSSVPLVNFILAIVWAANKGTRVSLRNYGRAMLIWIAIVIVLCVILLLTGVLSFSALGAYLN